MKKERKWLWEEDNFVENTNKIGSAFGKLGKLFSKEGKREKLMQRVEDKILALKQEISIEERKSEVVVLEKKLEGLKKVNVIREPEQIETPRKRKEKFLELD